jgi:hypothetical protein
MEMGLCLLVLLVNLAASLVGCFQPQMRYSTHKLHISFLASFVHVSPVVYPQLPGASAGLPRAQRAVFAPHPLAARRNFWPY